MASGGHAVGGKASSLLRKKPARQQQYFLRLLPPSTAEAKPSKTLWLCLYFPKLVIEAVCPGSSQPAVVVESSGKRIIVYSANQAAQERGIAPGHSLASALALVSDCQIYQRNEKKEQQLRHYVADFAYKQLSNTISLDYNNSVSIEIGHSRQIWRRLEDIKAAIAACIEQHQLTVSLAWAPTARAAYWLACVGDSKPVLSYAQLSQALHRINLASIVAESKQKKFHNSGLNTLGDVMRLPRDGLARRDGLALLKEIDEALGRRAPAMSRWYPLPYFLEDYELALPSNSADVLRPVVKVLLGSLSCFLKQRQSVTRRVQLRFLHRHCAATVMTLGFTRYVCELPDMLRVFEAQLPRCQLAAEVVVIELCCRQFRTVSAENNDFLRLTADGKETWEQLQELLSARFGEGYFKPLTNSDDHRPEYAAKSMQCPSSSRSALQRPLWLLTKAQPLTVINQVPYWRGQLYLEQSFERIEQGWWQGDDVRRDYYVAKTDAGAWVWVYRDLRQGQWYLHGLFG